MCAYLCEGDGKVEIRRKVWDYLEDNHLALFPRPAHRRISNFRVSFFARNSYWTRLGCVQSRSGTYCVRAASCACTGCTAAQHAAIATNCCWPAVVQVHWDHTQQGLSTGTTRSLVDGEGHMEKVRSQLLYSRLKSGTVWAVVEHHIPYRLCQPTSLAVRSEPSQERGVCKG